ncbi:hypothetical protein DBV05_g7710 [Lasiodiplodia theobromae]|uniref:Uncharacterized protein n=1 Tax=Lasiodiplodia theobromae TaxID=45133 RepID=A0A5N5D8M8_9PEZI|nr:hypothetical protein DBV05_g7710 [Lasiodiplodia theobromae]
MHFSIVGACFLLAATLGQASPIEPQSPNVSNDLFWLSKRCCILCDNPYARCGSNDKREAVESEDDALFGPTKRCCINCDNRDLLCKRDEVPATWPAKRCCILCDNPYARCGGKDKREPVDSLDEALFGPVKRDEAAPSGLTKRCCILCDNPHVRCGSNDKREAVNTLEEALFGADQQ